MFRLKLQPHMLGVCLAIALMPATSQAQTAPMNLETLKKVLAVGEQAVPTAEVLSRVKKEGVDFFLDADMKTELILAAAEGGRTESNTLSVINSLADSCVPCKERLEGPVSPDLALKLLKEQVRSRDVLKEVQKRGLSEPHASPEQIAALQSAGASKALLLMMNPSAQPGAPEGFQTLPLAKSKDFNPNAAYGTADIRARIDEQVQFVVKGASLYFKVISGKEPVAQASTISSELPRVPQDAVISSVQIRSGRSKSTEVAAGPADPYGFPSITFSINDEKAKDSAYQIVVNWQLKPYTVDELKADVEEMSGSYPDVLADWVRRRGYGTPFNPQDETTLRTAGASPALISTIRGSIRTANTPPK